MSLIDMGYNDADLKVQPHFQGGNALMENTICTE